MCVSGCMETVARRLSRRDMLKGTATGVLGLTLLGAPSLTKAQDNPAKPVSQKNLNYKNIIDLTYTLDTEFPTFGGEVHFTLEKVHTLEKDGYNLNKWHVNEHTGTHIDAPLHFSAGNTSVDEIPIEDLIVPLAVIDIAEKTAANPDSQLTVEDIKNWEAKNGRLPDKCCVAMYSGWGKKVGSMESFRNVGADGKMHFPGFSLEAVKFLMEQRSVNGIGVDTLSLDYGMSENFDVHYNWLPGNRWGIENLANLDKVPASGAQIIVGAPKVKGGTGGPSRVIALF